MNIPQHWHRAQRGEFFGWGWSSENEAAARDMAESQLANIEQLHAAGELRERQRRYYSDRPMREPVLREFHAADGTLAALVTRNSYGCLVLNTARALFVDVDFPETPPASAGLLGRIFGKKSAPPPDHATVALEKAAAWAASRPGWSWRAYRTRAGLRLLATHALFEAGSPEVTAVFDALGADPLYRKLCVAQRCFRARLTPKPWRCGHFACPVRWPWNDAEDERGFAAWQEDYTESCKTHATTELAAEPGARAVHPDVAPLIEFHDSVTRCGSALPLA